MHWSPVPRICTRTEKIDVKAVSIVVQEIIRIGSNPPVPVGPLPISRRRQGYVESRVFREVTFGPSTLAARKYPRREWEEELLLSPDLFR